VEVPPDPTALRASPLGPVLARTDQGEGERRGDQAKAFGHEFRPSEGQRRQSSFLNARFNPKSSGKTSRLSRQFDAYMGYDFHETEPQKNARFFALDGRW
jgi:hypothetical protein